VFGPSDAEAAGPFGPCAATFRLDFSTLRREGVYRIEALGASSLPVRIADDVYRGAADSPRPADTIWPSRRARTR